MNLTRIRETIGKIVKKFSHTSKLPEKKTAIAEGKKAWNYETYTVPLIITSKL